VAQAAPPLPQALMRLPGWQVPPASQQPEQEVESQTHAPFRQCFPVAQPPHVAPLVPHSLFVSFAYVTQLPVGPPLQQPDGQEVESQTHAPLTQCVPVVERLQFTQIPPLAPHCVSPAVRQVPFARALQQPLHPEFASQMHEPNVVSLDVVSQRCPVAHDTQALPSVPQ
jgi:hypothetical protein